MAMNFSTARAGWGGAFTGAAEALGRYVKNRQLDEAEEEEKRRWELQQAFEREKFATDKALRDATIQQMKDQNDLAKKQYGLQESEHFFNTQLRPRDIGMVDDATAAEAAAKGYGGYFPRVSERVEGPPTPEGVDPTREGHYFIGALTPGERYQGKDLDLRKWLGERGLELEADRNTIARDQNRISERVGMAGVGAQWGGINQRKAEAEQAWRLGLLQFAPPNDWPAYPEPGQPIPMTNDVRIHGGPGYRWRTTSRSSSSIPFQYRAAFKELDAQLKAIQGDITLLAPGAKKVAINKAIEDFNNKYRATMPPEIREAGVAEVQSGTYIDPEEEATGVALQDGAGMSVDPTNVGRNMRRGFANAPTGGSSRWVPDR